jgi:hypothetical protein
MLTGTAAEVDDFVVDAHVCIFSLCQFGIASSNTRRCTARMGPQKTPVAHALSGPKEKS